MLIRRTVLLVTTQDVLLSNPGRKDHMSADPTTREKSDLHRGLSPFSIISIRAISVLLVPVFGKKKKKLEPEEQEKEEEHGKGKGVSTEKLEENYARRNVRDTIIKMPTDAPPVPKSIDLPGDEESLSPIPTMKTPVMKTRTLKSVTRSDGLGRRGSWSCPACNTDVDGKIAFCTYCGQPNPGMELEEHLRAKTPVPEHETPLSILKDYSDAVEDTSAARPSSVPKRPVPPSAQSGVTKKNSVKVDTQVPVLGGKKESSPDGSWSCSACGEVMVPSYKFCTSCGRKRQ